MKTTRLKEVAATLALLAVAGPAAVAHPGPHDQYGGTADEAFGDAVLSNRTLGGDIAIGMRVPTTTMGPAYAVDEAEWALPVPPSDHRWVRYWEDALLIDEVGTVRNIWRGVAWDAAPQLATGDDENWGYGAPYVEGYEPVVRDRYARRRFDPRCFDADDRSGTAMVAGAVGGAVLGGVAGNVIAGRGDRTAGTLIGGGVGAIAGGAAGSELGRGRRPIGPCPGDEVARSGDPYVWDADDRYDDGSAAGERIRIVESGTPGRLYGGRPVVSYGAGDTTTVSFGGRTTTVTTTTYYD